MAKKSTITLKEVIQYLEEYAPLRYQESYDNSGLQLGDPNESISSILISLDVTLELLREAKELGCNLIIAHHPLFFTSLKKITPSNDKTSKIIYYAIKNNIAIYALHTNFDNHPEGINQSLLDKLGIENLQPIYPFHSPKSGELHYSKPFGAGRIGKLPYPLPIKDFIFFVKKRLSINQLRYTVSEKKTIKTVALCGGSGGSLIPMLSRDVDVFITADLKYHQFGSIDSQIMLIDIGHYYSEITFKHLLHKLLLKKFTNIAAYKCNTDTNPIHYS